jgi:hypothetical protein
VRRGIVVALAAAVVIAAAAAGYHQVRGRTVVLTFTEAEIQERLSAAPPFTRRYLGVFQVTVEDPRIALVEGSDRLRAGADVVVEPSLGRRTAALRGSVGASGTLRYAPGTGEFFLDGLVVEELDLPGLPEAHAPRARDAVTRALSEYYRRNPVHTLRPTDLRRVAAKRLLRDVRVADGRVVVTLGL